MEPFFLPEERWTPSPADWSSNLTRGKRYDTSEPTGAALWAAVLAAVVIEWPLAPAVGEVRAGYGAPTLVAPRLGQGAFRVMVTDAYERRCVVTGELLSAYVDGEHAQAAG